MTTNDSEATEQPTEPAEATAAAEEEATPQARISALEEERDQMRALAQRTQADFINYRRRMEEERELLTRSASSRVIIRLLPIVDDFQRALDALPEDAPDSWNEGIRMILRKVQGLIESEGVTSFAPAPGDPFDPAVHEAVAFQPSADHPAGSVHTVMSPGYKNGDRVMRPAQVVVVQETPAANLPQT